MRPYQEITALVSCRSPRRWPSLANHLPRDHLPVPTPGPVNVTFNLGFLVLCKRAGCYPDTLNELHLNHCASAKAGAPGASFFPFNPRARPHKAPKLQNSQSIVRGKRPLGCLAGGYSFRRAESRGKISLREAKLRKQIDHRNVLSGCPHSRAEIDLAGVWGRGGR